MRDFEEGIIEMRKSYPGCEILNISFQNYLSCYTDNISGCYYSLYGITDQTLIRDKVSRDHPVLFSDQLLEDDFYQGYSPVYIVKGDPMDLSQYVRGGMPGTFYVYQPQDYFRIE